MREPPYGHGRRLRPGMAKPRGGVSAFFIGKDIAPEAAYWRERYEKLSCAELCGLFGALRAEARRGGAPDRGLLPRVLGAAAESCRRHLGLLPYPAQYAAAASLTRCEIVQMNTGEGKSLTAVLPACRMALDGRGVHVITVNEYLARRDYEANRPVFEALGLSVGLSLSGMNAEEKQAAYGADITYATATELGFDYLRDGVAVSPGHRVLRELYFAIVDEADSILLDEAVTPMILSGGGGGDIRDYKIADTFARYLKGAVFVSLDEDADIDAMEGDYIVDERRKNAVLTAEGIAKAERYYRVKNLFDAENIGIYHRIQQAVAAYGTLRRDVDYIVRDGQICIVDFNTGRVMEGRRFSCGLHQAVEAKERAEIHQESRVISSITYQNFFCMYRYLSGMTGTAWTSRRELSQTYGASVRRIQPNRPCVRLDRPDRYFASAAEKLAALASSAQAAWKTGRPVLIGTPNVGVSESVSSLLAAKSVPHAVLNAKQDAGEAGIIAGAGLPGSVIVATNMAGRGTDIRLGGGESSAAERVRALGGLLVLGAERQRSRRVDDQLAGRAGRQGDPGESVFFVSPEDDLLRLYGQDCRRLTPKAVRRAQREAESFDAEQRKNVLETDNVLQAYRRQFLRERDRLLTCGDICALLREMAAAETARLLRMYDDPSNRYANFRIAFCRVFGRDALPECTDIPDVAAYAAGAEAILREKAAEAPGVFSELVRAVLLQCADEAWTAFLEEFEQLKQGYRLMSVGKSDSRQVLIRNAAELLDRAGASVREEGLRRVFLCRLSRQTES